MQADAPDLSDAHLMLLCGDAVGAIVDRPADPPDLCELRRREAWTQIHAYEPRTPLEAMLAARAVLYQSLALDAALDAGRATTPEDARRHRQQATALGRLHLSFLREISRSRAAAGKSAEQPAAPAGSRSATPSRAPAQDLAPKPPAAASPAAATMAAPESRQAAPAKDPSRTNPPAQTASETRAPAVPDVAAPPAANPRTASPPATAAPAPDAGARAPAAPSGAAQPPAAQPPAAPPPTVQPPSASAPTPPPASESRPPDRAVGQPARQPAVRVPELAEA